MKRKLFYTTLIFLSLLLTSCGITGQLRGAQYKMIHAARSGNLSEVKAALAEGADINKTHGSSRTALENASASGEIELVKFLLDNGAEVNIGDALAYASSRGHIDIVQLLLDKGADANKSRALFSAVSRGYTDIALLLLEKGADVNKSRALFDAVSGGYTDIVLLLLEKGADIEAKRSDDGATVLMVASELGHTKVVKLLLAKGAKVYARMKDSRTALDLAKSNLHQDIVQLLESYETDFFANMAAKETVNTPKEQKVQQEIKESAQSVRISHSFMTWAPGTHQCLWILAIGVGQYKDAKIPSLPFAKSDAEHVRDWLTNLGITGMTRDNVHVLFNEQATRENVLAQIDWLRKKALPEDAVFVYFAGHGAPELSTDGTSVDAKYLVLYDTNPAQLYATGFSLDELTRRLDGINAKTQVVILEACYAGPVGQEILKKTPTADLEIRPRSFQQLGEKGGRVILSASSGRQMAIGSDEIKGSLFTHYLLNAWGDGSKGLLSDRFVEAQYQVRRKSNELGSLQEPKKFGDENVDVILKVK